MPTSMIDICRTESDPIQPWLSLRWYKVGDRTRTEAKERLACIYIEKSRTKDAGLQPCDCNYEEEGSPRYNPFQLDPTTSI